MRIISGKYKGKRIIAPKNLPTRPTTDQAKESLFNILWNHYDFKEMTVLDLYSGIGSISLELASRGTTDITAVDNYYKCYKFLKETAATLEADIKTVKEDVFVYLKRSIVKKFDLVFADPPYDYTDEQFEEIRALVFKNDFLKDHGLLIIEHSKHSDLSELPNYIEQRNYGSAVFSFFKNKK